MKTNFLTGFATLMMTVLLPLLIPSDSEGGGVDGDFNSDGFWDCLDIDALVAEIVAGTNNAEFDMNGDGVVVADDVTDADDGWLTVGGRENPSQTDGNPFIQGDVNLDGVVDASDFIIWNAYKFSLNTAWCRGNVNADAFTDVSDWNIWNLNKFTSSSGFSLVPEPTAVWLAAIALLGLVGVMRPALSSDS